MVRLPTRQVHLDFHTSECIPGVGSKFGKETFQEALRLGHFNSITIFAKCHHGWSYYPTQVGVAHPTLTPPAFADSAGGESRDGKAGVSAFAKSSAVAKAMADRSADESAGKPGFDLTGAMIAAAHEIGVRAPIYYTVGWSAADAERRPEWLVRNKDGSIPIRAGALNAKPEDKRPYTSWKWLCPSGGYAQLIYDQTREICARYSEVDGFFYDICFGPLCWCETCRDAMKRAGLNPEKDEDAKIHSQHKWQQFMTECCRIVRETHPNASIFFNGGANPYSPQWHDWQTHFELEDLPTTWGGYDKFPLRAKYFAHSGKDYLGMTGKFHTSWGEFGGFKSPEALRWECAAMLAFGARCSVGDQMHPSGEMDLETYRLIGHAYEYIERIEPWCYDVEETTRLGIVLSGHARSDEGLTRMLMEAQLDFDVVRQDIGLDRFECVILPDSVLLDEEGARRFNAFIATGGALVLTGASGLDAGRTRFLVDVGGNYMGAANYENDYVVVGAALAKGPQDLVKSPVLFYEGAEQVWPTDGEVLAGLREPYFNRTYAHYCSHRNTPYRLDPAPHPAALRKGKVIYLAHPVCRIYYEYGTRFHRDYFLNALHLAHPEPILRVEMPSAGRAHFVRQPREKRYVLHLLYAPPLQRGCALVLEDMPPLRRVKAAMRVRETVKRAYLAPSGKELAFAQKDGVVTLMVPEVSCHQMVVLDYAARGRSLLRARRR